MARGQQRRRPARWNENGLSTTRPRPATDAQDLAQTQTPPHPSHPPPLRGGHTSILKGAPLKNYFRKTKCDKLLSFLIQPPTPYTLVSAYPLPPIEGTLPRFKYFCLLLCRSYLLEADYAYAVFFVGGTAVGVVEVESSFEGFSELPYGLFILHGSVIPDAF